MSSTKKGEKKHTCENCANDTPEGVCKLGEVECWKCAYGMKDRWQPKPLPISYAERNGKHQHGYPGKSGTTLWHPIERKHKESDEEALVDD